MNRLAARAVDGFTDRVNCGEAPDPADSIARFPQAADLLRDLLPDLLAVHPALKRAVATSYPNVVQVFDHGQDDGRPFPVLGNPSGGSLGDQLRASGKFPPAGAAKLMASSTVT